jgi:hypothetical protein
VLVGCDRESIGDVITMETEPSTARFQLIGKEIISSATDKDVLEDVCYYVDRYTDIIYVYAIDWDANATRGMLTVLYNAEGNPMTRTEFEKEIK